MSTPYRLQPKEARAAWVTALRSGKYQQGDGALRRGDLYCCLGVACEIFQELEGVQLRTDPVHTPGEGGGCYLYDKMSRILPVRVAQWLGLRTSLGVYSAVGDMSLARKNDFGIPFSKIADLIESEPVLLFETPKEQNSGNQVPTDTAASA